MIATNCRCVELPIIPNFLSVSKPWLSIRVIWLNPTAVMSCCEVKFAALICTSQKQLRIATAVGAWKSETRSTRRHAAYG